MSRGGAGAQLAAIVANGGLTVVPGAHDVATALLIEQLGFPAVYVGGYAVSLSAFGLPDTGLVSVGEFLDYGRRIIDAVSLPVILDLDDCGGSPLPVLRNVRRAAEAGAAAVQIEDTDMSRGKHFAGRPPQVLPIERAVANVRAAVEACKGTDTLVIARTDILFTGSLDEAILRINAFADVGADIGFICLLPLADIRQAVSAVPLPLINTFLADTSCVDQIAKAREDGLRLILPTSMTLRASYTAVREALVELQETERDPSLETWAGVAADLDVTVGSDRWAHHL